MSKRKTWLPLKKIVGLRIVTTENCGPGRYHPSLAGREVEVLECGHDGLIDGYRHRHPVKRSRRCWDCGHPCEDS